MKKHLIIIMISTLYANTVQSMIEENEVQQPLFDNLYTDDIEAVRSLLEKYPSLINKYNDSLQATPLHYISDDADKKTEMLQLLLEKGANPNIQNKQGKTALALALQQPQWNNKQKKFIQALLQAEADPNIKDRKGKNIPHQLIDSLLLKTTFSPEEITLIVDSINTLKDAGADFSAQINEETSYDRIKALEIPSQIKEAFRLYPSLESKGKHIISFPFSSHLIKQLSQDLLSIQTHLH